MSNLIPTDWEVDELEERNWKLAVENIKLRDKLHKIKGPLEILIKRDDKLKPEYKLEFSDKQIILKILEDIG
jgi:predicted nuclease with TOPRIM domain